MYTDVLGPHIFIDGKYISGIDSVWVYKRFPAARSLVLELELSRELTKLDLQNEFKFQKIEITTNREYVSFTFDWNGEIEYKALDGGTIALLQIFHLSSSDSNK